MRTDLGALAGFVAGAIALAAASAGSAAEGDLVVRAGHAFVGGAEIEHALVVVRAGRIIFAGLDDGRAPPPGARVVEARDGWLMPGLVDARSRAGLSGADNEEAAEVLPRFRAVDLVDPSSPDFARALQSGVTSVGVAPGGRAVIGGLVGVAKTDGRPLADRIVKEDAALAVTLGLEPPMGNRLGRFQQPYGLYFRRPGNRMGVVAEIRRAFDVAPGAAEADPESARVLRRARSAEIPTFLRCRTAGDVLTALRLSEELSLRPVLLDVVEGHRVVEEIAAAGASVIVGPFYQQPRDVLELWEGEDVRHGTARLLDEAGVPVAIATGPSDPPDELLLRAGLAARHGLRREAALAGVTSVPARLLGVHDRVGALASSLDGDLLLLNGDPLSPTSRVLAVAVEGRVVHEDPSVELIVKASP